MKKSLAVLLLATALTTAPTPSYAVSGKAQSAIFYTMSVVSAFFDAKAIINQFWSTHVGFDPMNIIADALHLAQVRKRHTFWTGIPPSLQAQRRLIGGFEEEEGAEEYIGETDVHVMALTNTGIEALFDGGEVATTAAAYSSTAMLDAIQQQFGTPHITSGTNADLSGMLSASTIASVSSAVSSTLSSWLNPDSSSSSTSSNTDLPTADPNLTTTLQKQLRAAYSETDKEVHLARRRIHRQKTAASGLARAELLQSVCRTDNSKERIGQLESVVGGGESISGQAKIYAALEVEFCGRLNMINVVQGNMLAVDAADALNRVE